MRRAAILSGIGGAVVLACAAWFAAAQVGVENSEIRSPPKQPAAATGKIDLNVADLDELARLPGMTPQLAEQIIRGRPYRKLDDLITRKVLGKKQFAKVRDFVVVGRDKP
jgi:competence protein ComEA